MNRLNKDKRTQILACLCEGMSIRGTSRICAVSKDTVCKFVVELGNACIMHHDRTILNVASKRLQLDEIWAFVGCKQRNIAEDPEERGRNIGDVYTFTALDADTKLIVSWEAGERNSEVTSDFILDLAGRVSSDELQITTDGFGPYPRAIGHAFKGVVDYAVQMKIFTGDTRHEARYSPPALKGIETRNVFGNPNPDHISTAFVERANLTQRMHMRRFTRLTNAHSKKLENHIAAQAIYFTYYNFVRVHGTLRTTPAMAAGIADEVWDFGDMVDILASKEPAAKSVWSFKQYLADDKEYRRKARASYAKKQRESRKSN